jgi:hypothetical protein
VAEFWNPAGAPGGRPVLPRRNALLIPSRGCAASRTAGWSAPSDALRHGPVSAPGGGPLSEFQVSGLEDRSGLSQNASPVGVAESVHQRPGQPVMHSQRPSGEHVMKATLTAHTPTTRTGERKR